MSKTKQPYNEDGHVFRDKIEEFRDPYYVTYLPAQRALPLATLSVVYPASAKPAAEAVKQALQAELKHWWARYKVPTMAQAWAGDDSIPLGDDSTYLVGYEKDGSFHQEWCALEGPKVTHQTPEELAQVYHDIGFRVPSKVRESVTREWIARARTLKGLVFLIVVFPVLIEAAALWISWLGHVMAAISMGAGLIKLGRTMGWIEASPKALAEQEEEQQMKHHHYHCKRNPMAFLALKAENFKKDLAEREKADFERIRASGSKPRKN